MTLRAIGAGVGLAVTAWGAIRDHDAGKALAPDAYIRVVSESESPVQSLYVRSKDGLAVAVALRKPKGDGPFPVLIFWHGWPGGRGIEPLSEWCRGVSGSPVLERFLQAGFVVVASDYRGGFPVEEALKPIPDTGVTALDDCLAVLNHIRSLPFVDAARINLYGSSFGGNLAAYVAGRRKVHAAILGGAVLTSLLGAKVPPVAPGINRKQAYTALPLDAAMARRNVNAIQCPVLLLVGGDDFLEDINRQFYKLMVDAGKPIRMEFYRNAYHGFETGPGAMAGPGGGKQPLLEAALDALERAIAFAREPDAAR